MAGKLPTSASSPDRESAPNEKEVIAVPRKGDLHEFRETEGYVIEVSDGDGANASGLKLAEDGHTVLIPQPSDDGNDPLNWSWTRKHLILFAVSWASFLPDYGSATGAVTLIPQAAYANPSTCLR